ncbi:hypothetical protein [Photobacterium phosphoreum]|uniref:hypothetical protein n=1 Tax=Photobacterium phosphoreum TaxID=659 RepID=UPI00242FCBEE|nr:hypothetical protein [Photobacterium phosphoreum]
MRTNLTQNYVFRKFTCGLSKKDTAELCFKSVTTITRWDKGRPIPPECKRLMRIYKGMELATINPNWEGWKIKNGELTNSAGVSLRPEQILTGYALLEINSENERALKTKIIQTARMLRNLP